MINEYAQSLRREIHQHPEIGFDLDNTLMIIRRELDQIGWPGSPSASTTTTSIWTKMPCRSVLTCSANSSGRICTAKC